MNKGVVESALVQIDTVYAVKTENSARRNPVAELPFDAQIDTWHELKE